MLAHVHLLLGHHVTAKVKGVRLRRITCQHCGEKYVYQLRRTAKGSAYAFLHLRTAQKKVEAQAQANQILENFLRTAEDEVPCPACGHLQPHMLQQWRNRNRRHWILGLCLTVPIVVVIVVVADPNQLAGPHFSTTLFAGLVLAALIIFCWAALIVLRDPNRSPHRRTREALGPRCRALPAHEFDALLEGSPENNDFSA